MGLGCGVSGTHEVGLWDIVYFPLLDVIGIPVGHIFQRILRANLV